MDGKQQDVAAMSRRTLKQVIDESFERYAGRTAVRLLERRANGRDLDYQPMTYADLKLKRDLLAAGLYRLGMRKGQRIGILTDGGFEPLLVFLAADAVGVSAVPLCIKSSSEVIRHGIEHSQVQYLLVDVKGNEQLRSIGALSPAPKTIVAGEVPEGGLSFAQVQEMGRGDQMPDVELSPDDESKILYTSGSSGLPKGVVQTGGNIVANLESVWDLLSESETLRMFKSAPDYHSMGILNIYYPLAKGWVLDLARSPERVLTDIRYSQPNGFVTVPLILDKVYGNVRKEISGGGIKGKLISRAVVAKQRIARGVATLSDRAFHLILGRRVIGKIRAVLSDRVGENLELLIVGSAKADPEALEFFHQVLDITTFEGYGATECAPLIATNHRLNRRAGTVGCPLFEVQLRNAEGKRIGYANPQAARVEGSDGESGELWVHGANVMPGYLDDKEQTARVLVEDAGKIWYRTGDLFTMDHEGFLSFRGRLGRQFKLRNGEFVNPELLERHFARAPLVEHVLVYGDQSRSYPLPLVAVDLEEAAQHPDLGGLREETQIRSHPMLAELVRDQLLAEAGIAGLPSYERPQKVLLLPKPLSEEAGTLTKGLKKIVPTIVTKQYRNLIEQAYGD